MKNIGIIEFYKNIEVEFDDPKKAADAIGDDCIESLSVHIALRYNNHHQNRKTLGDAIDNIVDLGDMGRFQLQKAGVYVSVDETSDKYGVITIREKSHGMRSNSEYRVKETA